MQEMGKSKIHPIVNPFIDTCSERSKVFKKEIKSTLKHANQDEINKLEEQMLTTIDFI